MPLDSECCPPLQPHDRAKVEAIAADLIGCESLDAAALRLGVAFPGWRIERPRGEGVLYLFDPLGWKRMIARDAL